MNSRFQAIFEIGIYVLLICAGGCTHGDYTKSMHHSRTNVLWLTLCTLRADHLGAYGYQRDVSPFIDSLAAQGIIFDQAIAPASWTRASIAATITGIYPRTLNIEEPDSHVNNRQLLGSFRTLSEYLKDDGYYTIGITANPNTHSAFNFDQGYDYYQDTGKYLWRDGYGKRKLTAEDVNASLLEQLRGLSRKRKFFAHLTYVDVHAPLQDRTTDSRVGTLVQSFGRDYVARYDMEIRFLDMAIAGLFQDLEAMGVNDVLVIITSDHGEAFGRHHEGDEGHGRTLYNETVWVPFILNHPSLDRVKGRRSQRVELMSLVPTVLDFLGIDYELPPTARKSLKELVLNRTNETPSSIMVTETCFRDSNRSALFLSDWKLISTYSPGEIRLGEPNAIQHELFQLDQDWLEAHNLATTLPNQVEKMSALLSDWQTSHNPKDQNNDLDVEVSEKILEDLRTLGYIK